MATLQGRDIICFSNDWDGDPLSKTHLMRLAAQNNRVLWVNSVGNRAPRANARDVSRMARKLRGALEGVREVEPNIFVLAPLAIPLFGHPWARSANAWLLAGQVRRAARALGMRNPIALSYLPASAPAFDRLGAQLCVYHCVDEFSAFEGSGLAIAQLERELIRKSDLVICSSEQLQENKRRLHPRVELVRHGVDHAHFRRALEAALPVHPLLKDLPRPIIGFTGLIAEWVDLETLGAIADHFREGTVVIAGKEDTDTSSLRRRPNVRILGRLPYGELPSVLKGFDVALVPFLDNELARASNPLKAREYLAAGLPVVSSNIPEVERLGLCHIARRPGEFIPLIERALAEEPGPRASRSEAIRGESWAARWEDIASLIAGRLQPMEPRRRSA